MKYLGWCKISDCMGFWSWVYWDCWEGDGMYYRILGFELKDINKSVNES